MRLAQTPSRSYFSVLLILFALLLFGHLLAWPVSMTDTDTWYHLSGGRYFWQNDAIADNAFFSYITPEKSWYNYYWLFQAILYKLFQWTDYYGLIGMRSLLYFLTALFVCLLLCRGCKNRTELLTGTLFTVSSILVILPRELIVRPHLFSYLFVVVFLFILERRQDKIWMLPVMGVLWANLHGIEFPVMYIIVFAYLAEAYWLEHHSNASDSVFGKKEKWIMIAVFYTVFATPGIIQLVQTPFSVSLQTAAYQHLYVNELLPVSLREVFVFTPISAAGLLDMLQNLIIISTVFFFILALWKRKMRLSHALLFVGALALLTRHRRFTYEFTLLSLPLLHHGISMISTRDWLSRRAFHVLLPITTLLVPAIVFHGIMGNRPAYPFSEASLPTGIVRFLNHHVPGGRILNEPNTGGYLPWALNNTFKIFMDMQMTIFSDADFAFASNALSDPVVFQAFVQKYDPSFLSVSLNRAHFQRVVDRDPRFVPVFFDHAELLYANRAHYPEIVKEFGLQAVDPFHFREIQYDKIDPEELARIGSDAERMLKEDPTNYGANHILAGVSSARHDYRRSLSCAETLITNYPAIAHGYALKADALYGLHKYQEAARLYEKALTLGQTAKNESVYWNLHACYAKLGRYRKAYRLLSRYVHPFSPHENYKEIYQLGLSAASIGKTREAILFLSIADLKTPLSDAEYSNKIKTQLSNLQQGRE